MAAAGRSALLSANWAEASGAWRALATTKGPFGLGSATKSEAVQLGMDWVGPNPSLSSSGALVSANGLRQWRPPTYKTARGTHQSNFEWRSEPSGPWVGNGHLEVPEMNQ